MSLARAAYTLLLRALLPLLFLRFWWRGRREPGYRLHWGERLGRAAQPQPPGRLWIHAVSLGETLAAAPLLHALRERRPGLRVLLTHGTATGRDAGTKLLQPGDAQAWLPLDTPGAVRRFLRAHRPIAGVLMETEVWPNLLHAARAAGVPMVLANARLSARSAAKGQRLRALMRPAMAVFTQVLAQSEDDAGRLRQAGARDVQVLGNLKFDLAPPPALLAQGARWRATLGRPVVLAASTREGEEAPLLRAWAVAVALPVPGLVRSSADEDADATATATATANAAAAAGAGAPVPPRPLLLVVPRHPQRFDEVAASTAAAGLTIARRSGWQADPPADVLAADAWIGDSLGEMPLYYALAEVALLGGSFAPLGGQNLIEAAACGCPLLMGPHTFNFAQAAEWSLAAGAAERLPDLPQAVQRARSLLGDGPARTAMAAQARAFAALHRGAADRMAAAVAALLPPR